MVELSPFAIEDLKQLREVCTLLGAECVLIGAVAFQAHFPDEGRHTKDVDVAVALNLESFHLLRKELTSRGWTQRRHREHEWKSARETRLDILLAGPKLQAAKSITWPESEMTMSLMGFEHVFSRAIPYDFAADLTFKVIPPVVLALLKIAAFLDDPHRREKDLYDIRDLFHLYEANSDREFSDEVLDANLPDISLAPAFLLGRDLRAICLEEETALVRKFIESVSKVETREFEVFRRAARLSTRHSEDAAVSEIQAFSLGFL
jgi:predicted nucleotidyltransferase